MKGLGYVDGNNISLQYGATEEHEERLARTAADLVRQKPSAIIAVGAAAGLAAQKATSTIPIVFLGGGDPVALGLIRSLPVPGGNITGITEISPELTGKRLELITEAFPKIAKIAVLVRSDAPGSQSEIKLLKHQALGLKLELQILPAHAISNIKNHFRRL